MVDLEEPAWVEVAATWADLVVPGTGLLVVPGPAFEVVLLVDPELALEDHASVQELARPSLDPLEYYVLHQVEASDLAAFEGVDLLVVVLVPGDEDLAAHLEHIYHCDTKVISICI